MTSEQTIPTTADDDHYFGACPVCHDSDGYLNVGRTHWFFCLTHRVRWCVGANLFSSWRDETETEQRAQFDELDFGSFEVVKPHRPALVAAE